MLKQNFEYNTFYVSGDGGSGCDCMAADLGPDVVPSECKEFAAAGVELDFQLEGDLECGEQ